MPWKKHPVQRIAYSAMYIAFFVAGIFAFFFQAQALLDALKITLAYGWAGFLSLGGIISLWSPLRNTWNGELLGLPLLSASHLIFGLSLIGFGRTPFSFAVGLVFCGFACGLTGRWVELKKKSKLAREVSNGSEHA